MGGIRHTDTDPGWINRRFRDLERKITEANAAKRLAASTFPDGVIPSSALASPAAPGFVSLSATGFGVLAAGANIIDTTVAVPPGFDSCVVSVTGRVFARNSTAVTDYLYARVVVADSTSTALPLPAAAGGSVGDSVSNVAPTATVLRGIDTSFVLQLWAGTSVADWAVNASNTADLTGVVLWFR